MEKRECPEEFQQRLNDAAGLNPYGEPNFRIVWGQSETFRAGGVWPSDHFIGYRQVYASTGSPFRGSPCWMILEWDPAERFNGEALYYFLNRDETTGLQTLGEYPYSGRYKVALKLSNSEVVNGVLHVEHYHLDSGVIDYLIPIIIKAAAVRKEHRQLEAKYERARAEEKLDKSIDMVRDDARMAFGGAASSYRGKQNKTSLVTRRMELIERQMKQMLRNYGAGMAKIQRGFQQA
jgi:hypothetical protein